MADNIYEVDLLVTGTQTITITDDGSGNDWIILTGDYPNQSDLRLSWTSTDGTSTSAMGLYFEPANTGHRLVVNGLIENVRGSNGRDYISGNEVANILYGDVAPAGAGDADTLEGGDGDDWLFGGAGNDNLGGGNDDDILSGDAGDDTLSGGSGFDTVEGGKGADILSGGSDAVDILSYAGSAKAVTVKITHGSTTLGAGGDAKGDQIFGFKDVWGSALDDKITDTVKGEIAFGYNANTFDGREGNDILTLGGGNDTGIGGNGNDTLLGEQGKDDLSGGNQSDVLTGGKGADSLTGGGAADDFVFTATTDSTSANRDTITDFNRGQKDDIDLSGMDGNGSASGMGQFVWIDAAAFSGVAGQVRWVAKGAAVEVQVDTDGNQSADLVILVQGVTSMQAGDFVF